MRNKGFALATTLVIAVVVLVMGLAGMYVSEMGFRSLSAEQRWHLAEKAANAALMETARRIIDGTPCNSASGSMNFNNANVLVQTREAGGACFLWAQATLGNARVVKVSVITARSLALLGAANFLYLDPDSSLGGSGAIASCDDNCRTSALLTGNSLTRPPNEHVVEQCPNNPRRGTTALVDPYVPNAFPPGHDLTGEIFDNLRNRDQLLEKLSEQFHVQFQNGAPVGISNRVLRVCTLSGLTTCSTTSNNNIRCGNYDITWQGGAYDIRHNNNIIERNCGGVDLGNATLSLTSGLRSGGALVARNINLGSGEVTGEGTNGLTLIARNLLEDGGNHLSVNSVNVFAQNILLNDQSIGWSGGVLYTGGGTATSCSNPPSNGCFYIDLNSNSRLGSQTQPVLIVVDNNMTIRRNGNAEIYGLIFATSNSNEFVIGAGNGTFDINGMVVDNSPSNNRINFSGNFEIWFNSDVIRALSNTYTFVKPPLCNPVTVGIPFMQTKTTTY